MTGHKTIAHTAGPWRIGTGNAIVADSDIGTHSDEESASCYGGNLVCESVKTEANARLIAAAPELLEALKLCVPKLHRDTSAEGKANYSVVRAAILKAEGKQP